jgi:hypothetical protein
MKIPPANPLPARPAPETNRAAARRGQFTADATRADDHSDASEAGGAAERDFASVFDEVVARPEPRDEEAGEGDRRVSRETERAENDGSARRREEREGGGSDQASADGRGGGFEHRAGLRDVTAAAETTPARSILHVADLERIVSAVRAQNLKNAQAIVIALKHSVLEGLQIKLTVDENGKLKAEFLAASEQIKNQLDARRHELTGIIRERGINLSEMSVRQGSDFSQNNETGDKQLSEKNVAPPSNELLSEELPEESDNDSNNRISYRV